MELKGWEVGEDLGEKTNQKILYENKFILNKKQKENML